MRARLTTPAIAAALFACCMLPATGIPPRANPNEVVRVEHAVVMAMWATHDLSSVAMVYGLSEDIAVRNGRVISDKAPGLSLLAVPAVWIVAPHLPHVEGLDLPMYWPLRHVLVGILAALPAALAAWAVGRAAASGPPSTSDLPAKRLSAGSALAVALGFSTPLLTYGTVLFGHALAAGLVALAWMPLLVRWRHHEPVDPWRSVWSGFAAGFAVGTEYPTAILAAVLGIAVVSDRRSTFGARAAFCGAAVLGMVPMLTVHDGAFGAPWLTGYSFKADQGFQQIIDHGIFGIAAPSPDALWGVLLSPERGLLWYSPVLVLAVAGLLWEAREDRRGTVAVAAACVLYVAFAAGFVDWRAGWCAAARHLTPIIPLLTLLTVDGFRQLTRSVTGTVTSVALATVSTTHAILSVALTPFFPVEFDAPLTQLVIPSLAEGLAAPTVIGAVTGAPNVVVWLLAGFVALAVVTACLAGLTRRRRLTVGVAALTVVVHGLLLIAAAAARPPELEPHRVWLVHYLGLSPEDAG